jgi:hypothetical protein
MMLRTSLDLRPLCPMALHTLHKPCTHSRMPLGSDACVLTYNTLTWTPLDHLNLSHKCCSIYLW